MKVIIQISSEKSSSENFTKLPKKCVLQICLWVKLQAVKLSIFTWKNVFFKVTFIYYYINRLFIPVKECITQVSDIEVTDIIVFYIQGYSLYIIFIYADKGYWSNLPYFIISLSVQQINTSQTFPNSSYNYTGHEY